MTFSLLGRPLSLPESRARYTHNAYFLELLGIEAIDVVRVQEAVSRSQMKEVTGALLRHVESASAVRDPSSVYVYTTQAAIDDAVELGATHAFSVIGFDGGRLQHHYYEKQHSGRFRHVAALSHEIDGPLDADTLRLLHFANTPDFALPARSSIFLVTGGEVPDVFFDTAPDTSLQGELLLDPNRSKGAVTLGVNEPDIYAELIGRDPEREFTCGHNDGCRPGQDRCVYDPMNPVNYCSDLGPPPTCLAARLAAMKRQRRIAFTTPVKFRPLRVFRDEFLARTRFGREYIGFYYLLSGHARLDPGTVRHYVAGLQHAYKAIAVLTADGDDDQVVVTPQLRQVADEILARHADLRDPAARRALTRIARDLDALTGMSKTQFLAEIGHRADA
jgi:hypothetical protein